MAIYWHNEALGSDEWSLAVVSSPNRRLAPLAVEAVLRHPCSYDCILDLDTSKQTLPR
jgi:hypothetical protein